MKRAQIFSRFTINLVKSSVNNTFKYIFQEWDVPAGIDLYAYHWNNMWLMGDGPTTGHMMANAGYKMIMSPATHLYLDHAQYEHPHSRGLMWATRSSNLTKVFSFRPFDFYRNGLTYIDGNSHAYLLWLNDHGRRRLGKKPLDHLGIFSKIQHSRQTGFDSDTLFNSSLESLSKTTCGTIFPSLG